MKSINYLLAFFVITFLAVAAQAVNADPKWSAVGILTTQVQGKDPVARPIEIDDFESKELCDAVVKVESRSQDYLGQGGTNGSLPIVHWNYDADCIQKRN